jgi:two-component sensor histidine kinase
MQDVKRDVAASAESALDVQMPDHIHQWDWAATPLGPKEDWSPALRTTYDIVMGTGFAACATWGDDQTLIYNAAYIPFLGARHPAALGRPIDEVWHDVWDEIAPLIESAKAGERVFLENMHLVMSRNGYPEDTYWTFSYSALLDEGRVMGILNIAMEATASVLAERNQSLLVHEATHRVKNTLAMVQAIAKQSLRGLADRTLAKTFEERLQAFASAHDILFRRDWAIADLQEIISGALDKIIGSDRYTLQGPAIQVSARVAQTASLLAHELATNALKHGALTAAEGKVDVAWGVTEEALTLVWRESGGPPAAAPTRRGFGSRLIDAGLAGTGGAALRYDSTGLTAEFTAPIATLLER